MPASNLTVYRLTLAARDDLANIWLYALQQWSIERADRYTDILEDTFDRLLFMPEMVRERWEFDPPTEPLIIYGTERDHLVILRVLGAGQDWQAILRAADEWPGA